MDANEELVYSPHEHCEGRCKPVSVLGGSNEKKRQTVIDEKERAEGDESGEEYEGALSDSSDAEVEDASNDEYDDDEDENKSQRGVRKNVVGNRGRKTRKMNLDVKGLSRKSEYDDDEDGNKSQRGIPVLLEAYTTLKSYGPMVMSIS